MLLRSRRNPPPPLMIFMPDEPCKQGTKSRVAKVCSTDIGTSFKQRTAHKQTTKQAS